METCASYLAMIIVQLAYAGGNIIAKIALDQGLNQLVFLVYRHLVAMFLLSPFAYVLERKDRPSLSVSVITKIFVLTLLGTTVHLNLYFVGLKYTSATVASAIGNVIPSFTFLLAFLLRMETVKIKSSRGQAKVLGTIVCIGGSLIFTFWKGYLFKSLVGRPLINVHTTKNSAAEIRHPDYKWIKGSLLVLISEIAYSSWLILQVVVCKVYPARLSLTTLICFFASLQSSFLCLFFARDPAVWKLGWNFQLLTVIYYGVITSGLGYFLQIWCISKKGPVFAAMFIPLVVVFVAIFSAIAFAERLHLGSFTGAFLIIVGLYSVLWGKTQDNNITTGRKPEEGKGLVDVKNNLEISIDDKPLAPPVSNERK